MEKGDSEEGAMKVNRFVAVSLTLLIATAPVVWAGDWRTYTPLPGDISIEEPRAEEGLNPKIARLSGVWQGELRFYGLGSLTDSMAGRRTTIVVERISGSTVAAILSVEAYNTYAKGGWERVLGRVEGKDRVVFRMERERETKITLRLLKDNIALAEWESGTYYLKARLERRGQSEERAPAPAE
ncbi:MAG: hypothetical protein ABSH25_01735 [Syntrophorhabdales bacterium]